MGRYVALHPKLVESEKIASEAAIESFKNEILEYLQTLESSSGSSLNPVMIDNQPEITWLMRPYIIDFLVELHLFFKLSQETLFLACFIADRYCTKRIVYKRHYQLLVATSLWIAAKFQDKKTRIPTLKELCLLCHQIYDSKMILQMEKHILTTLEWNVGNSVSTYDVVQSLLSVSSNSTIPKSTELLGLTSFLCDLSLYQRNFMCYSSSTKAITALLLASRILGSNSFPEFFSQLMPYCSDDNDPCFHIAGDYLTNDLSLSLCKQTIDGVRNCFYLFLKDIFEDKMTRGKEFISNTLVRKYKHLPIVSWLNSYRSSNFELYAHLCSLNDSLKLTKINPYSTSTNSFLNDSISSCLDEFAGFKNSYRKVVDFNYSPESQISLNTTPFTPLSSFSSIDLSKSNRCETPNSASLTTESLTPGQQKFSASQLNAFPPTPGSASSIFSARPRLSASSSTSSFNSLLHSSTSNAGYVKMVSRRSSRSSNLNIRRSISGQEVAPSIYE